MERGKSTNRRELHLLQPRLKKRWVWPTLGTRGSLQWRCREGLETGRGLSRRAGRAGQMAGVWPLVTEQGELVRVF